MSGFTMGYAEREMSRRDYGIIWINTFRLLNKYSTRITKELFDAFIAGPDACHFAYSDVPGYDDLNTQFLLGQLHGRRERIPDVNAPNGEFFFSQPRYADFPFSDEMVNFLTAHRLAQVMWETYKPKTLWEGWDRVEKPDHETGWKNITMYVRDQLAGLYFDLEYNPRTKYQERDLLANRRSKATWFARKLCIDEMRAARKNLPNVGITCRTQNIVGLANAVVAGDFGATNALRDAVYDECGWFPSELEVGVVLADVLL